MIRFFKNDQIATKWLVYILYLVILLDSSLSIPFRLLIVLFFLMGVKPDSRIPRSMENKAQPRISQAGSEQGPRGGLLLGKEFRPPLKDFKHF